MIPRHAEVSAAFHDRNKIFRDVVQRIFDSIEPWEVGEDPIETFLLPRRIGARAVLLATTEAPLWGVNPHHKARRPDLSPYIGLDSVDPRNTTKTATLELTGTVERPILTRAYPGEYMPPLPWMSSARKADGGRQACIDYWNSHAYILRDSNPPHELTNEPPEWYTPSANTPNLPDTFTVEFKEY